MEDVICNGDNADMKAVMIMKEEKAISVAERSESRREAWRAGEMAIMQSERLLIISEWRYVWRGGDGGDRPPIDETIWTWQRSDGNSGAGGEGKMKNSGSEERGWYKRRYRVSRRKNVKSDRYVPHDVVYLMKMRTGIWRWTGENKCMKSKNVIRKNEWRWHIAEKENG